MSFLTPWYLPATKWFSVLEALGPKGEEGTELGNNKTENICVSLQNGHFGFSSTF